MSEVKVSLRSLSSPELFDLIGKTPSCDGCNPSACCSTGTIIKLHQSEREQLQATGTELEPIYHPKRFQAGLEKASESISKLLSRDYRANYRMVSNCGNLQTDELGQSHCADYENRPAVCQDFVVGALACHTLRATKQIADGYPARAYEILLDREYNPLIDNPHD